MKKILIIAVMLFATILVAVDFHPGSGDNTASLTRDTEIKYHTSFDDHHWFGSSSWAVKYEFNEYSALYDTLQFNANGAYIYFPGGSGSDFTVSVCSDSFGQPNMNTNRILYSDSFLSEEGWNQVNFDATITDTTLWLVVDYETNSTDKFVSGSANDGNHSYFSFNDYYYSLYSYSFESELLFSLFGNFELEGSDLELVEVNWNTADFSTGDFISPQFIISNNSANPATGISLSYSLENPVKALNLVEYTSGDTITSLLIPDIPAGETLELDFTDSLHYELSRDPAQYEYSATLSCPSDSLLINNSCSFSFDTFNLRNETVFIENSLIPDDEDCTVVLEIQDDLFNDYQIESINYYADESYQPFYSDDAFQRFNYYHLMGNPATMINGDNKIIGYLESSYQTELEELFAIALATDSTFINFAECTGTFNLDEDVNFNFVMQNDSTLVYASFLEYCTIYVAVVEDLLDYPELPGGITVPVLRKIVAAYSAPTLGLDEDYSATVSFNRQDDYETISSYENSRIVYWLQDEASRKVYFIDSLPFSEMELTDIYENEIESSNTMLNIYPNPYSFQGNMKISFSLQETSQPAELKIYNMKGQLVRTIQNDGSATNHTFLWNGKDGSNKKAASGIYLMRVKIDNSKSLTRKCLLLKE